MTYVSSDPEDIDSLTPNHFLLGRPELSAPLGIFEVTAPLTRQWQYAQKLSSYLWNRQLKKFVHSLRHRTKWTKKSRNLKPGELVWILEDNTLRGIRPVGRIIKPLNYDRNDQIRKYEVKIFMGKRTMATVKLAPILDEINAI